MPVAVLVRPFAVWLDRQMKDHRINQSQLAAYLDTSPSVVSAWLKGGVLPKPEMCAGLARVLP
ncbi:MAG: helix-turn-helix transcriptional regulator [Flavobacteriales bacterium]|nr:helix-turn-helix transcriptional regulator [Flavobacteriales bacterium]